MHLLAKHSGVVLLAFGGSCGVVVQVVLWLLSTSLLLIWSSQVAESEQQQQQQVNRQVKEEDQRWKLLLRCSGRRTVPENGRCRPHYYCLQQSDQVPGRLIPGKGVVVVNIPLGKEGPGDFSARAVGPTGVGEVGVVVTLVVVGVVSGITLVVDKEAAAAEVVGGEATTKRITGGEATDSQ